MHLRIAQYMTFKTVSTRGYITLMATLVRKDKALSLPMPKGWGISRRFDDYTHYQYSGTDRQTGT